MFSFRDKQNNSHSNIRFFSNTYNIISLIPTSLYKCFDGNCKGEHQVVFVKECIPSPPSEACVHLCITPTADDGFEKLDGVTSPRDILFPPNFSIISPPPPFSFFASPRDSLLPSSATLSYLFNDFYKEGQHRCQQTGGCMAA